MSRDKRASARTVRRALRASGMSPEVFARLFSESALWGASARTLRRWAAGETVPHASVLNTLRTLASEMENAAKEARRA